MDRPRAAACIDAVRDRLAGLSSALQYDDRRRCDGHFGVSQTSQYSELQMHQSHEIPNSPHLAGPASDEKQRQFVRCGRAANRSRRRVMNSCQQEIVGSTLCVSTQ
jgi:hypothetical protein